MARPWGVTLEPGVSISGDLITGKLSHYKEAKYLFCFFVCNKTPSLLL